MVPAMDVKHINPFLQSSISIVESVTQVKLTVGKPEMTDFIYMTNIMQFRSA